MRIVAPLIFLANAAILAPAAEEPPAKPPPGALVLFDGKDASKWNNAKVEDGVLMAGAITKDTFQDFKLHVEFKIVPDPEGAKPQQQGNSGIYLQKRYEIQILDSFGREPTDHDCGAIYRFKAPDANASKKAGEWQTYDITFRAPRFQEGEKIEDARISLVHNGVRIHNNVEVPNKTGKGDPEGPEPGPILLQYHGSPVVFRNIWIVSQKSQED